jgi:hypothetical protein
MENSNLWGLLRSGNTDQEKGLELARCAYGKNLDNSHTMQLGVALLWLGQYHHAWEHFRQAIERNPKMTLERFYGMAGVAKWCLGENGKAVAEWLAGLKAKYAGAAGLGVKMPLLLLFASVIKAEVYDENCAMTLVKKKAKDRRINNWPGPILQWIAGQIDGNALLERSQGRYEYQTRNHVWQAEFYESLNKIREIGHTGFRESMQRLADTSQPEWRDENIFLTRIWTEEFFLARNEAMIADNMGWSGAGKSTTPDPL